MSGSAEVRMGTAGARWVIVATALGSGMAFLDGSIVNVALPAIGSDLNAAIGGLQWTINSYLITLTSLLLLGGSLGDRYGRRRVFIVGLVGFALASMLCAIAPTIELLVTARTVQGVAAALLVPGSLSIIAASFHDADRGKAIGIWSGLAGISTSIGPFLGGWLIDAVSWRLIFLINLPLAGVAVVAALRIPQTQAVTRTPVDYTGGVLVTLSLAAISYACIEHRGLSSAFSALVGVAALGCFIARERVTSYPMLPLQIFRHRQVTGANATTFAVYAGLSGALFLLVLRLQETMHYSALEAGAALAPFSLVMLVLSPAAGALGQRIGPRVPMTVGPLITAGGMFCLSGVGPGDHYLSAVLPGVLIFSIGMSLTVAPLTTAVLASVPDALAGAASGVNNAVARLGGLIAIAVLPALAGIQTGGSVQESLSHGYGKALDIAAVVAGIGGVVAWVTIRDTAEMTAQDRPAMR